MKKPLVSYPEGCVVGLFLRRHKRFSVAVEINDEEVWVHSNNSGSMLGLMRKNMPILLSPANNPARKLRFTQECVWMSSKIPNINSSNSDDYVQDAQNFWVGVNTSFPNKLLHAAFSQGLLPFAYDYTHIKLEAKRGQSRLDACISGDGQVPIWVECKNVTMVEDEVALFPDARTERGQKHLLELMDIVKKGERAVMFYLVQRTDAKCFGPADMIDEDYAKLFWKAIDAGVEVYPFKACIDGSGVSLGEALPVVKPHLCK